ncbi:site-specific integrase [Tenacibaculum maritimum]|nr:site-specific integrase [Tenacibaculum maritimum]MDB0602124.1 site-specific integrase [Tenacibaculum maritimum]MDB0613799.1 site-specific integrase [Tenacibaculum maritimum]
MSIFEQILQNAYTNAYTLDGKKLYSEPKIYDAKGDLSKRWYVYYYFRNPDTGKMTLQPPLYKGANRFKTKKERTEILTAFKFALKNLLSKGYNPYEDASITEKRLNRNKESQNKRYTVEEALSFAVKQRKPFWSEKSKPTMISHYNKFIEWLKSNDLLKKDIEDLKKRDVSFFLNSLKKKRTKKQKQEGIEPEKVSPKTRNNYRATLSSLFSQLENDEIVDRNFVGTITKLKSTPKKNKPFSNDQIKSIREYLDKNDPYLRVFVQFISYAFLRNIEVCRLRVSDIDLANNRLYVRSKTESQAIVPIIKELSIVIEKMNIHNYRATDYLITRNEIPSVWDITESSKTDHFSKRFSKVKQALNLGKDYTIYSFRHAAATNLYISLLSEGKTEEEAISYLMSITRHKSKAGLRNYLREIGATLPKDYSDKYTIQF